MDAILPSSRRNHIDMCDSDFVPEDRPIIGLDFGTTNTVMAQYIHNFNFKGPQSITFTQTGDELYPSIAWFDYSRDKLITGQAAYRRRVSEPWNIISSVKRNLEEKNLVIHGHNINPKDVVHAITRDVLNQLRVNNPYCLPQKIVASVPYHFMQPQNMIVRNAIQEAFKSVFGESIDVTLIPEPVASALYWLHKKYPKLENRNFKVLVFDIGGGTIDLSYVRISSDDTSLTSEVVTSTGDSGIGGDDIDMLIYDYIIELYDIDLQILPNKKRIQAKSSLMDAVIIAKQELSYNSESAIVVRVGDTDVDFVLKRETLEDLLNNSSDTHGSFMERIETVVKKITQRQSLQTNGFDYIVLVGGPTKMPIIRNYMRKRFPDAEILAYEHNDEHLCVAKGASIYAAMLIEDGFSPFEKKMSLNQFKSRTLYNYYIEKYDGSLDILVKAGQICPVIETRKYIPTKLKLDDVLVDLSHIKIYQGKDKNNAKYIGSVDIDDAEIYSHGRKVSEIPVSVRLTADSSIILAEVFVEKGNKNYTDYRQIAEIQI